MTTPHSESPADSPDAPNAPHSDAPHAPRLTIRICVLFYELEPGLFQDFIHCFQTDLLAKYPDLPQPCPGSDAFVDAVAPLLREPEDLPPRMHEALLAIQELAGPTNRQLLSRLLACSGINAGPATPHEHQALQFWLRCPFTAESLPRLQAQLPAMQAPVETLAPLPTPPSSPSSVPGDLAALASFPRYKISHLSPDLRESINQMLRQRVPYARIIEKLGDPGKTLNKSNLSRWKKTGYLLWLAEQQRREDARTQLQLLFDLVRENENGKIHEATQQIAALRISQVLAGFEPAALVQALEKQPQAFVRLVQTLPSLSRGGMDCERLLVEFAELKASLEKETDPKPRGLSERTRSYFEQKLNLM